MFTVIAGVSTVVIIIISIIDITSYNWWQIMMRKKINEWRPTYMVVFFSSWKQTNKKPLLLQSWVMNCSCPLGQQIFWWGEKCCHHLSHPSCTPAWTRGRCSWQVIGNLSFIAIQRLKCEGHNRSSYNLPKFAFRKSLPDIFFPPAFLRQFIS